MKTNPNLITKSDLNFGALLVANRDPEFTQKEYNILKLAYQRQEIKAANSKMKYAQALGTNV